jgi:hypothetical protein
MTSVAIMQPTYLPWLGYFALMAQVDTFVFLDSVQFDKRSWQQRNKIKTLNGATWLSTPVLTKGGYTQNISDVLIDPNGKYPNNHIKTIESAYGKAPFFKQYSDELFSIMTMGHENLASLTIETTKYLAECFSIKVKYQKSSDIEVNGKKAELLARICKKINADTYISPIGSSSYIEASDAFLEQGIEVLYNDYFHPEYSQLHNKEFISHLSGIDLLFNIGPESRKILASGFHLSYPYELKS